MAMNPNSISLSEWKAWEAMIDMCEQLAGTVSTKALKTENGLDSYLLTHPH